MQNTGARRLWVAAGLSVLVHGAIAVSVQRNPGGSASLLTPESSAPPLIARLVMAVGDSVLSAAAPALPPTPETTLQSPLSPGTASTAIPVRDVPTAPGSAYYFKTSELDRRPFPLARIEVPPPASTDIDSGAVIIRLRISERGRVEDAKIVVGTGIAEFETSALREFSQARFHPGYRGSVPVRSEMLIEVTLHPPQPAAPQAAAGAASALAPAN